MSTAKRRRPAVEGFLGKTEELWPRVTAATAKRIAPLERPFAQRDDDARLPIEEAMMLDHMGFAVRDYDRSKAFYEKALAPLGLTLQMEPLGEAAGFGEDGKASFWIEARGRAVQGRLHVAFEVDSREQVDTFHVAALEAGGTDNGGPGVRKIYHPDYYGAYILDPDGNNPTGSLLQQLRAVQASAVCALLGK
jgi:catechol 2,3-dioxygenase-like lactoylglutathione lyase family enzyme